MREGRVGDATGIDRPGPAVIARRPAAPEDEGPAGNAEPAQPGDFAFGLAKVAKHGMRGVRISGGCVSGSCGLFVHAFNEPSSFEPGQLPERAG